MLASMKRIGDLSGELRDAFKGDLREKLAALMRSLIDGVYLMLTERKIDTDRWTATRAHTGLQIDQLLASLSRARRD